LVCVRERKGLGERRRERKRLGERRKNKERETLSKGGGDGYHSGVVHKKAAAARRERDRRERNRLNNQVVVLVVVWVFLFICTLAVIYNIINVTITITGIFE
jgi:hypothetical protein